jgi:hypothetical protein
MLASRNKEARERLQAQWGKTKNTTFNFYQIARYHARRTFEPLTHLLSERTLAALDFSELFGFLDRTVSRVGQQYLFSRLAAYDRDENRNEFEQIIHHASINERERLDAQVALSRLQHDNAYGLCTLFYEATPVPPQYLPLIKVQSALSIVLFVVTLFQVQFIVPLIAMFAINAMVHYYCKSFVQQYTFAMDQLVRLTRTTTDLLQLSFPYQKKGEVQRAMKSVREVTSTWTILGNSASGGLDSSDLAWLLREYIKIAFLIEPLMFFRVISKLSDKKDDIRCLFEYAGFIDTCIAVLSVRQSFPHCVPVGTSAQKGGIVAEEMFHPLISKCQANSWNLNDRSMLITGSNMSGKSAFIRTVAVNVLCAHTINTSFARSFSTTFLKVHAVMNISDDLMEGKSYYMEEVISIRKLVSISAQESECLFLLDEIFRGTNTTERIAAAYAVLTYLNEKNVAIAATHDSELTTLLDKTYDMYHFCESFAQDGVSFD